MLIVSPLCMAMPAAGFWSTTVPSALSVSFGVVVIVTTRPWAAAVCCACADERLTRYGAYTVAEDALPLNRRMMITPMIAITRMPRTPATHAHGLAPDGSGSGSGSAERWIGLRGRWGSGE